MQNNALIIFAKYPQKGKVKTRLAKDIGEENAVEFYKECTNYLFEELDSLENTGIHLFFASDDNEASIKDWVNKRFNYHRQSGGTLGDKMLNAFEKVLGFNYTKCVIIGTDIPDINKQIINKAFNELDSSDVVLGPSDDGGYYLLGMKKVHPVLFGDIQWSTDTVFRDTVSKLKQTNLSFSLLEELIDVDDVTSFSKWIEEGKNNKLKEKMKEKFLNEI